MNLKQIIGFVLLTFMLASAYALFGGVGHENAPLVENTPHVVTNTSEISEYHAILLEEHAAVDFGAISLIAILIGVTSVGGIINGDGKEE
jgi:hypothetical protein